MNGRRTPQNPPSSRRVEPREHDTYKSGPRPAEATQCRTCGVQFHQGRWIWPDAGQTAGPEGECPACKRKREHYPAGVIDLEGDLGQRGEELENMIRNLEEGERSTHALERLMKVERTADSLHVETTGVHLARRIASALERQKAQVTIEYSAEQAFVRVEAEL